MESFRRVEGLVTLYLVGVKRNNASYHNSPLPGLEPTTSRLVFPVRYHEATPPPSLNASPPLDSLTGKVAIPQVAQDWYSTSQFPRSRIETQYGE